MSLALFSAVHPGLLAGAALIAVPILIHLLNKRRFRIVDWAAMDLLRQADRKNRRRLRLEDLLILLLRCLAVILLALLVARPIMTASASLARVTGARTERIVVLDDSPSMDVRQGNRTLFTRATAALADSVRKLSRARPGDTLTVILTSAPDQPWINGQILGGDRAENIAGPLESLPTASVPARLEQTFLSLLRRIENEPPANRSLYVISDFRRHDWLPDSREGGVPKQLGTLAGRIPDVTLVNLGQSVAVDLAVTDIRPGEPTLVAGVPCPMLVTIANRGTRDADDTSVTVASDGIPAGQIRIPAIAPGTAQTLSIPVTFARAGSATVEAEISRNDTLAMDDRRAYAGTVESAVRVLVVDGEPDPDPVRSETFYLRRALAPPGETVSGMGVDVIDENGFDPRQLDTARILILCNVYRLPEERWRAIAEWVRLGGGLVVFTGDQMDGASWNDTAGKAAPGLLPVRFDEATGDASEREWQTLRLARPDHPILQAFSGDRNPFLQRVKVYRYWRMEPAGENASVLAVFANGRPALSEMLFGAGRVLVFATAADTEWSNWPSDPSYVVTLQQTARTLARAGGSARCLTAGQPLHHEVTPSLYRSEARLFAPEAHEPDVLRAGQSTNASLVAFDSAPLRQPGVWALDLSSHEGEVERVHFAVNIDATESDLDPLDPRDLQKRTGDAKIRFADPSEMIPVAEAAEDGRAELTRPIVTFLLGILLLEQGLAWRFGRKRKA